MRFIIDFIKGILVGIANVIPGVSGGTMAVSLGIYDRMISSITGLLKDFKKSFLTLLPIIAGAGVGIVLFSKAIEYLLGNHALVTAMAFTGLIIGGLPIIIKSMIEEYKEKPDVKKLVIGIIVFLIFLAISVGMPLMSAPSGDEVAIQASPLKCFIMLLMGIIASATMVIPGVSGSLLMMILGFYFGIIGTINHMVSSVTNGFEGIVNDILVLLPFGIGAVLGIFLISKIIKWLFAKFPFVTYCGIMGLVISSPFAIFYKVNQESSMAGTGVVGYIVGIIVLIVCGVLTFYLGKLEGEMDKETAAVSEKEEE